MGGGRGGGRGGGGGGGGTALTGKGPEWGRGQKLHSVSGRGGGRIH